MQREESSWRVASGTLAAGQPLAAWSGERLQLAQGLWRLTALPLWRIARLVETPFSTFCTLVSADPGLFPQGRCQVHHVPTAEDLSAVDREAALAQLALIFHLSPGRLQEVIAPADAGTPLAAIVASTGLAPTAVEVTVRALGYAPPPQTPGGLAQYRLITSNEDLARTLGVDPAQVVLVQRALLQRVSVYRQLHGAVAQDAINLIAEWSGHRARWRTTIVRRRWWLTADAILARYDAGVSVKALAAELGVDAFTLYDFLHRHGRQPLERLQLQRHYS